MDILEQIINDTRSRNEVHWNACDVDKELEKTMQEKKRIPHVPSILHNHAQDDGMFLIAEVKHASPSQGIICENFNPVDIARTYIVSNVDAISILTEETFFKGHIDDLQKVRLLTPEVPLLRKDFIVHPFQVWEAYNYGADMVLLIVAALEDDMLQLLYNYIVGVGMTPLVEVHDEHELERAMRIDPMLIGINNRNLRTFQVDINTSIRLKEQIPPSTKVIAESGIAHEADARLLKAKGIDGILVGQSILESDDMEKLIRDLKLK